MPIYKVATGFAHLLPAEMAHNLAIQTARIGLWPKFKTDYPMLNTDLAGLKLPNPVGLAAGFDKNALIPHRMLDIGFGFVECGTVTPKPQEGNPKPRLFRVPFDRAIINRMGFNNKGLVDFSVNLERRKINGHIRGIVGANLGANKETIDRGEDYIRSIRSLWKLVDYFTINISSPNTPGLRELQNEKLLDGFLQRITSVHKAEYTRDHNPPMFLKVAPDLNDMEIWSITKLALKYKLAGLVISNTTITRPDYLTGRHKNQDGGMSGAPLLELSTKILYRFYKMSEGQIPLIGVGGVLNARDAYLKFRAGATAIQLYSGLVYQGPGIVRSINRGLVKRLKRDGYSHISEVRGTLFPDD